MTVQNVTAAIRSLLWKEWDPIGVYASSCPATEYDEYADEVVARLARGATVRDIADLLLRAETIDMRLPASRLAETVARKAWGLAFDFTRPSA